MTTDKADTARSVLASARRIGIFPPRAWVTNASEVPERLRGKTVRVLGLVGLTRDLGVVAHIELEDEPACMTMNVPPQYLRFMKVEPEEVPLSPLWEQRLHKSAIVVVGALWRAGDKIEWAGRVIERSGKAVRDSGHFILDRAIKIQQQDLRMGR